MRRLSFLALTTLAACSFPDVTIEDKPGDSSAIDTGANDTKSDSTNVDAGDDTSVGEDIGEDSSAEDTEPVLVDTTPPDVTAETNTCDKDGDGYQPAVGSCVPGTKGADCDDLTGAANPGVKDFIGSAPPLSLKPSGDWDCNGIVEKQFPRVADCTKGSSLDCSPAHDGLKADLVCGASGTLVRCKVDGLLGCVDGATSSVRQGCK
jgi:hypothetical protein